MKIVMILCTLLIAVPAWAGTFRDNFEDGNYDGWTEIFAMNPNQSVWKVINGVLIGRRTSGWVQVWL